MQISWIDDADIAGLIRELAPESVEGQAASAPGLPAEKPAVGTCSDSAAPAASAPEPESQASALSQSMRERLQAIRERALRSGALGSTGYTQPAPAASQPAPTDSLQPLRDFVLRHRHSHGGLLLADERGSVLGGADHQALGVIHELQSWIASNKVGAFFADADQTLLRRQSICGKHLLAMACPSRRGLYYISLYGDQAPLPEHLPALRAELLNLLEG